MPTNANIVVVPCKRTQQVTTLLGPTMLGPFYEPTIVGQQHPTLLGVVGTCCVRLHGPLVSFEVSDANALRYCSFMIHLHDTIAIITSLLSKVTYNTFLECLHWFFAEQNVNPLEFCLATQYKNTHCLKIT